MRLSVVFADRSSCNVGLHVSDANALFSALGTSRHFCRVLRIQRAEQEDTPVNEVVGQRQTEKDRAADLFVGWVGEMTLTSGTMEIAKPFAECLGLLEGESVNVSPVSDVQVAPSVMVRPHSVDDFEIVELQARYIEEHLLAQIAVLTPGMVFTIWIHGAMPVKLLVDPNDSNKADVFLLNRDSELYVESRRRTDAEKPVSIFGGQASEGNGTVAEPSLRLRVVSLSAELRGPRAWVHAEDLAQLAGFAVPEGCLAWMIMSRPNSTSSSNSKASGNTSGEATSTSTQKVQQLLRLEAHADVPQKHIILGTCLAEHAQIPCFALVCVWRCRQVPVYVPHLELSPMGSCTWHRSSSRGPGIADEDSRWLCRLFSTFVKDHTEVDVMDGAVVELRDVMNVGICCADTEGPDFPAPTDRATHLPSSCSEATDLYSGLSDIDDIYGQTDGRFEVTCNELGVYEVDLGLDEEPSLSVASRKSDGLLTWLGAHEDLPPRPSSVIVRVNFVVSSAHAELWGSQAPPFVRLTPRALTEDIKLTVAWPAGSSEQQETSGQQSLGSLPILWGTTPGLRGFPEEQWAEVVQLVQATASRGPLDGLQLFTTAAADLHRLLLAQLGCMPGGPCSFSGDSGMKAHNLPVSPSPLHPQIPGCAVPGACAVVGGAGGGKTTLCRCVLGDLAKHGVLPIQVSCAKLGQPSRKFKAVQEWLHAIFRFACWYSPSVVLLDDMGALCPDVEQGAPNLSIPEERSVIIAELILDMLPEIRANGARVAFVLTLPSDAALHKTLWRALSVEHKVQLRPPRLKERPEILQALCRQKADEGWDVDASLLCEGALDEWGGKVDGYSVADLCRLVERACIEATSEAGAALLQGDDAKWCDRRQLAVKHFDAACKGYIPATMADQSFFASTVQWSDVGGLESQKQELLDMLTMPTKYAVLIDRAPVRTRKGMMLVGPPGCGKTMLVHAAANETKGLLRFLTVKGPELLSKYIGASEAGVRQVFERAAAAAPSVIFFDEIESLTPKRGADSTGVTDRVVNQMLCYLDGVEDRGRVYVVAATSRPDLVDAALMRPGRFDRICYCGLPTEEEKLQICEVLAKKNDLSTGQGGGNLREALRKLIEHMPRLFTSADIDALFSSGKIEAVNEVLKDQETNGISKPGSLQEGKAPAPMPSRRPPSMTMGHLYSALRTAKASISEADDRKHEKVFAAYRHGGRPSAAQRSGPDMSAGTKVALA